MWSGDQMKARVEMAWRENDQKLASLKTGAALIAQSMELFKNKWLKMLK